MAKNGNSVRITSGLYKNREISTPGGNTHPMGSREKIALMNTLQPYLEGAKVLDMFAGSGALGLEALSRGAKEVTFIDNNREAKDCIKKNLKNLSISAEVYSDISGEKPASFDVIIADPPYDAFKTSEEEITNLINNLANLLKPNGILTLSHPESFPVDSITGLKLQKTKGYAACNLSYYEKA